MATDTPPELLDKLKEPTVITEGKAQVKTSGSVFYNPVQEFNRDLSISVLKVFAEDYKSNPKHGTKGFKQTKPDTSGEGSLDQDVNVIINKPDVESTIPDLERDEEGITIFEGLSATGLRSIRYAKEIPGVKEVIANDLSAKAASDIAQNIIHNGVDRLVKASCDDAAMIMYKHRKHNMRFSAIDLDPYGSPAVFLDAAVQAVEDGGLLLITATDMAVLAGNTPETCYYKYGAVSLRLRSCHEMALRILLQCIESHANRYGRYIVPLLSVAVDFYIRVFVKVFTGPAQCKRTTSKLSMVYECVGCEAYVLHPLGVLKPSKNPNILKSVIPSGVPVGQECEHCSGKFRVGGPIWSAPIHDLDFVARVVDAAAVNLRTWRRISGILSVVQEELVDVPLYHTLDRISGKVHVETPSMMKVRSAILNAGYRVSYAHAHRTSIKTDAPLSFLWDMLRSWETEHPVKREKLAKEDPAVRLLARPAPKEGYINWDLHPDANPKSRRENLLRYQENPEPNWGPGTRGTAMNVNNKLSKSRQNQGKYSKKRPHSPDDEKRTHDEEMEVTS